MTDDPKPPTIRAIQVAVAARFGVTVLDLLSDRQGVAIARPRQVAMWIARHVTLHSLPEIGRCFGERDHTTVMHAVRRVDELMGADAGFAVLIWSLRASVENVEGVGNKRTNSNLQVVA